MVTYPADRLRGPSPTAPVWAVARGFTPQSHYIVTETWADQPERYAAGEIVARGLTYDEAEERARLLNNPNGCQCMGCVRYNGQNGGRDE